MSATISKNLAATNGPVPIYFETSWAILSSIGLINVFIGFLVIGITSISPITIVPVIISGAAAIANGLCYYAFYAHYSTLHTAAAAGVADIFWLIQEAGLSFYSYQILTRILHRREKIIFVVCYWVIMAIITQFRVQISINRIHDILNNTLDRVQTIDHLHIGYFIGIASLEGLSSLFLLRKFFAAQAASKNLKSKDGLFSYLMKSTEVRLAGLVIIGITRCITYSFQTTAQSATGTAGQVDRFVVTLENLYPVLMFIDILAAKSLVQNPHGTSGRHDLKIYAPGSVSNTRKGNMPIGQEYEMSHVEAWSEGRCRSSSQEYIVKPGRECADTAASKEGIHKTVEFEYHSSRSPA